MKEDVEDKWVGNFVAAESRYHVNCYARFSSQRDAVKLENSQPGRKANTEMMGYFENTCDWLELKTVLHSVEVLQKMNQYVNDKTVYGVQYIKKLLVNRYKQHISYCSEPGRPENIVYFKEMADYLINKKYREKEEIVEEEAKRIRTLAANS